MAMKRKMHRTHRENVKETPSTIHRHRLETRKNHVKGY